MCYNPLLSIEKLTLMVILLFVAFAQAYALPPVLTEKQLLSPPPKIIRTCCTFGTDLRMSGIPFAKISDIISLDLLGNHKFLSDRYEGNGIIYTAKGGFLDIGHLRDCADLTAYYYVHILELKNHPTNSNIVIGKEGGQKVLKLKIPADIDPNIALYTAANIAFDLSIWHEIATWFGSSYVPLLPERFSSFSPEDLYSNLLGTYIGIEAISSPLPYDEAMTQLLDNKLKELGVVSSETETYRAMRAVEGLWWTEVNALPSAKLLLQRNFGAETFIKPWLVPGFDLGIEPYTLQYPSLANVNFDNYYELSIKANYRIPSKDIYLDKKYKCITNSDFDYLVKYIAKDVELIEQEAKQEDIDEVEKTKRKIEKTTPNIDNDKP